MPKPFKRIVKWIVIIIVVPAFLVLGLVLFALYRLGAETDADIAAMKSLISRELPMGSNMPRALVFLHSRHVAALPQARGFDYLNVDMLFEKTPSYDNSLENSQSYPGGKALITILERKDGQKTMKVVLFFNSTGHYTHYSVDEWRPSL